MMSLRNAPQTKRGSKRMRTHSRMPGKLLRYHTVACRSGPFSPESATTLTGGENVHAASTPADSNPKRRRKGKNAGGSMVS